MQKCRMIKFWCVAFAVILWNIIKGNNWHMVCVDFHLGDDTNGNSIRKQLIARRSVKGLDIYWQDLSKVKFVDETETEVSNEEVGE